MIPTRYSQFTVGCCLKFVLYSMWDCPSADIHIGTLTKPSISLRLIDGVNLKLPAFY